MIEVHGLGEHPSRNVNRYYGVPLGDLAALGELTLPVDFGSAQGPQPESQTGDPSTVEPPKGLSAIDRYYLDAGL